ncbi:hypothetical protein L917_16932 [Phytophthora nicotianae]|uniref:ZSWIM1/3 RNaseH-like domain-containing protein n=1 Tax=Phytophthora nicotianae TaxID=4792 RepID=W2KD75_PHYNI|nr:hypothetical protein L917_16932 [Phytophthora nicotianae]
MRRDSYTLPDDNIRVTELMQDFSEGPGNVVNVFRDVDTKLTSCITFQTCHMRRMTRLFLEVMCVDATHGTNINRYRLFSFMLTDKFGSGAFAQHSLIDGESRQNMINAVSAFKQNNPSWNEIKVIVVDKDFTEISTLDDEYPEATVILCHFHVIDYLKREVSKREYGFSSFEKLHLKKFLTMMVRASTEDSFSHYLDALKELCQSRMAFVDYLSANWLTCKNRWCTFLRGDIPHLDNNTNNRLKASWGAAKDILTRHMPMDECIESLLFLQQSAEDSYTYKRTRIGHRVNHNYDQEMQLLARIATRHACDLIEQ